MSGGIYEGPDGQLLHGDGKPVGRPRDTDMTTAKLPERLEVDDVIQKCDCAGFKRGIGFWFDDQDLRELRYVFAPPARSHSNANRNVSTAEEAANDHT